MWNTRLPFLFLLIIWYGTLVGFTWLAPVLQGVQPKTCTGTDKFSAIGTNGIPICSTDQTTGGGTGITSFNGSTVATQTVTNDTNITWTTNTGTGVHTLGFTGTFVKTRQNAATAYTDAANTWSTGAQDFSAAISLKLPVAAGAAPATAGLIAVDSTSNTLEVGLNGVNKTVAMIDGNIATATALAAAGIPCTAGNYARGTDASGNGVNCTVAVTASTGLSDSAVLVRTNAASTYTGANIQSFAAARIILPNGTPPTSCTADTEPFVDLSGGIGVLSLCNHAGTGITPVAAASIPTLQQVVSQASVVNTADSYAHAIKIGSDLGGFLYFYCESSTGCQIRCEAADGTACDLVEALMANHSFAVLDHTGAPLLKVTEAGAITVPQFTSNGGVLKTDAAGLVGQVTAGTSAQVLHGGTAPAMGPVTTSNLNTWDAARVYNSATEATTSGTKLVLTFDTENYDTNNLHSTSSNTSRLTCLTAGKVLLVGGVVFASSNTTGVREMAIRLNGTINLAYQDMAPITGTDMSGTVTAMWNCAVNDYFELTAFQNSTTTVNILAGQDQLDFSMQWLGN